MKPTTYIGMDDLLRRLNGYAERGQLDGLAFAATTKDGNYVTGYGGLYGLAPEKGIGPVALLQMKMTEDAIAIEDSSNRSAADH